MSPVALIGYTPTPEAEEPVSLEAQLNPSLLADLVEFFFNIFQISEKKVSENDMWNTFKVGLTFIAIFLDGNPQPT
jgi:hypothetical protein